MKDFPPDSIFTSALFPAGVWCLLIMTLPDCGSLGLSGDPPSPICGNGQREVGEECDGEAEPCDTQGCGGGTRHCLAECRWGNCQEDVFSVLSGPSQTNAGIKVGGLDNHLMWTGVGFNIVFTGKYAPEDAADELFLSRLTPDGTLEEGPSLITPPSRRGESFYILPTMTPGDFPMAILFNTNLSTRTIFNTFDLEGTPRWDLGVPICDDIFHMAMDVASSREETIGILINTNSFVVIDTDGTIMNESPLECEETRVAEEGRAVSENTGFLTLLICRDLDYPYAPRNIRLKRFDARGNTVWGPQEIPEDMQMLDFCMAVAPAESGFGVVFMSWPWEDGQENADLMFFIAGDDGSLILPPRRIGQASISTAGRVLRTVDMTWSGSEYGIAWVESVSEPEDPESEKNRINVIRISNDGSNIAQALEISSAFLSHTPDIEWSGSAYGLSWMEPPYRNPEMQINSWFALVGCGPPEN